MDTGVRGTVKFRIISIALTFGIVACAGSIAAQKKSAATSGPVVIVQDKGKLTIKLGGQTVRHEHFEIGPSGGDWLAKGSAATKLRNRGARQAADSRTLKRTGAPLR